MTHMSTGSTSQPQPDMSVCAVVKEIVSRLAPRYGEGEAKAMARIIFENIMGWSAVDVAIKANETVTSMTLDRINAVVERLMANEPIQYIFGNAWFYGMKLKVTRDTLIPRPETAELVDMIVRDNQRKDLKVMDLCTGSGCIAIALARNLPFAEVSAVDISAEALAVAKENSASLHAPVHFIKADLFSREGQSLLEAERYDIIVSNPPYIAASEKKSMDSNVVDYEPGLALFVPDDDPLEFYKAIFSIGETALNDAGAIYCEINPVYVDDLVRLGHERGFGSIMTERDSYGKYRFIIARR